MDRLIESLIGRLVLATTTVFKKPKLAVFLYALALVGVFRSPDRNRPVSYSGAATPEDVPSPKREDPTAFVLAHLEKAGLRTSERVFVSGEQIYSPGEPAEQLHFLRSGTVRLYKLYGGYKEATVGLLKDSGMFGRPDLEESGFQDDFAEAMTTCTVVSVRKSALTWLAMRDPKVSMALFSAFSERIRLSEQFSTVLLPREVSSRLAALLLSLSERVGVEEEEGTLIDLRLTHQILADMIASTREAVSKAMSEFQREGLIARSGRGGFVVLDPLSLRERAEGAFQP
ncbi:MAG TPA: Crp/Fnr family transcriptional regulator [Rubrobacteraceae bacterium]|nr:Crp/Fnr family transcriptional regulator [Rubrobacteraceae bacterium]